MNLEKPILQLLFSKELPTKLEAMKIIDAGMREKGALLSFNEAPRSALEVVFPDRPCLVEPRNLKRRSLKSREGLCVFLHAIAHIEFSAIHLAIDAAYRFRDQPEAFQRDWLSVALDEARHFEAVLDRMALLGAEYGDYPAHAGLWELAVETSHDVLARMALVPRCMEARGLDVAPSMISALLAEGDDLSVELLSMILREEIGHVAIGTHWYREIAKSRGHHPDEYFFELIHQYLAGDLRGPFNLEARRLAGFSENEIRRLQAMGAPAPSA